MNRNKNPLVSIIVPVYNGEQYIRECIASLQRQTYQNTEMLFIDDGSQDKSAFIIRECQKEDARIVYIGQANGGVSKARNTGIDCAKGQYLTFVDADDWVSETFLAQGVEQLEKHGLDYVLGGTRMVYPTYHQDLVAPAKAEVLLYDGADPMLAQKVLSNGVTKDSNLNAVFTSGPVCKIFRKEIVGMTRFRKNLVIGEDTVFNLEILDKKPKAGIVPQIWYYYRMNQSSATKKYNPHITEYTDRLMECLMEQYAGRREFTGYYSVRGIQQFYGMLLLGILNRQAGKNIWQQRKEIRKLLDKPVWQSVFQIEHIKMLPAGKPDKILAALCKYKLVFMLICFVKLRVYAKELSGRKNG